MKAFFKISALLFISLLIIIGVLYFLNYRDLKNKNIELLKDLMKKDTPIQASEIPPNITLNDFIELLDNSDTYVVIRTLNTLGFMENKEAIESIAEKLGSEEWLIRFHSADALGNIGSEEAIPPLKKAWLKETKWQVSHQIFEALTKIGGETVVQTFLDTFNEQSQTEKGLFATIGLFELTGNEQYLDSLKESFEELSDKSKLLLLWAIGTQRKKKFRPFLEKACESEDLKIKELAEKYILELSKGKNQKESDRPNPGHHTGQNRAPGAASHISVIAGFFIQRLFLSHPPPQTILLSGLYPGNPEQPNYRPPQILMRLFQPG